MTAAEFVERVMRMEFCAHGRSYDRGDCWAVVWLFYRDVLGIALPLYDTGYMTAGRTREDRAAVGGIVAAEKVKWLQVDTPSVGDVVLLRCGGRACHVGVMLDKARFVHIENRNGTMVESLSSPLWSRRCEGVYRHAA
jgi:cell wall-associated NlpC family hydrolase